MDNLIKDMQVDPGMSIKDALKRIDETRHRVLFVCDKNGCLVGSLTDGDIRRRILRAGNLEGRIEGCFNKSPVYVEKDNCVAEDVKRIMLDKTIEAIPMINEQGRIEDILFWDDIFDGKVASYGKVSVPVVIMAGGKGTRLDPFTKVLPKPLIPIGETPIIEKILDRFHYNGVTEFYVTLNYKGEMVKTYLDSVGKEYSVHYVDEKEFLGTAGSLSLLPEDIANTFIISNCDIIVEADYADLVNYHKENNNLLTIIGSIQHYKIPYGVIHFEKEGKIQRIQEKPEFDFTVNTGAYVLSKEALSFIPEGKSFDMTDLVEVLSLRNKNIGVYPVSQNSYIDIGQWDEYKKHAQNIG